MSMRSMSGITGKQARRVLLRNIWPFVTALVAFITVRLAVKHPLLVEEYYSDGFYTWFATSISAISRLLPFSLWDLFWFVVIFSFIASVVMVILKKMGWRIFLLRTGQFLSLLYAFFYVSWGFNYFRPDIGKRIGLEVKQVDEKLFRSSLDSVIVLVNKSYTSVTADDYQHIDKEVEESYSALSSVLDVNYPNGFRRPKKMIFSPLIAKFGISGYFGPFFNEINLSKKILPMEYPFLLAHEKAHQFGVAGEADANLAAFVVCTASDDPKLNYSGYLALLLYFLEDAQYFHDYRKYLGKLDKSVLEELQFRQNYYYGLQNEAMEKAHESVYDTYLKRNHVAHGIENYNQVVELAISWFDNAAKLSGH